MFLVNEIENGKGFKNFDWFKKNTDIFFNKDMVFIKKYLDLSKNEEALGFITNVGTLPLNIVNKDLYQNAHIDDSLVTYDFVNNEHKVWIAINSSFFHFFMDSIASIIVFHKKYPKIQFIIDFVDLHDNEHDIYLSFLKDFLKTKKINHVIIEKNFVIKINNFFTVNSLIKSDFAINEIYNFSQKYVKEKNKIPTKKVYISRKFTPSHRNVIQFKNLGIDINEVGISDVRVYNEKVLENFLKLNGFEIVYAEKFTSIKEQINYFNDVSLLIAATSSGLLNSIFMPPNGTVIDLITPIIPGVSDAYQIHSHQYLEMAYAKKHNYLGIPSKFYAEGIVEYFLKNQKIFDFITK